MRVRELITRLGFQADDGAARSYDAALRGVRNTALALASAAGSAAGAIFLLGKRTAAQGDAFQKMAVQAGMTAQQFQSVAFAMNQVAKVSDGEVERALAMVNVRLGDARTAGSRYAKTFREIGFSHREIRSGAISTMDVLTRMNRHLRNTDPQTAARIASELLGDRIGFKLGPAIARADTDLQGLIAQFYELGGGMSNEAAKAAEDYTDRLGEMRLAMDSVRYLVGAELLPVMTRAVEVTRDFLKENREIIRTELVGYMRALGAAFSTLQGLVVRAIDAMGGFRNMVELAIALLAVLTGRRVMGLLLGLFRGIATAGGIFATFRALFVGLIAIVGRLFPLALALALQDVWAWVNGQESAIERVLGKWTDFERKIRPILDRIEKVFQNPMKALLWSPLTEGVRGWLGGIRQGQQRKMDQYAIGQIEDYAARSGTIDRQSRINVTVDATINVPVGTPESAVTGFRRIAQRVFAEELDRQIGRSALDLEPGIP